MPDTNAEVQTEHIIQQLINAYCQVKQMSLQLLDDATEEKAVDSLCQAINQCDLVIIKLQHLQSLVERDFVTDDKERRAILGFQTLVEEELR